MALKLQSPILWIRALELVLGIVCFALTKQYGFVSCSYKTEEYSQERCSIAADIQMVAIVNFPVIIIPILIISQLKYGTKFDSNITTPMFAFVGFFLFIVAGSVEVNVIQESPTSFHEDKALTARGAMCIVTSLAFMVELVYWYLHKRNGLGD